MAALASVDALCGVLWRGLGGCLLLRDVLLDAQPLDAHVSGRNQRARGMGVSHHAGVGRPHFQQLRLDFAAHRRQPFAAFRATIPPVLLAKICAFATR